MVLTKPYRESMGTEARFVAYRQGCAIVSVEASSGKRRYQAAICMTTGECWCDCDDFWYRKQSQGIPTIAESRRLCKHLRSALRLALIAE
jgi:hypothetical protein